MDILPPQFSQEQWEFLSLLEFFGAPVSVDLIETLASLSAGPLLDLIQRGVEFGLIRRDGLAKLSLSSDLPKHVSAKLAEINSVERLTKIFGKLLESGATHEIAPHIRGRLGAKPGPSEESAKLEIKLAEEAKKRGDFDLCWSHLKQALDMISGLLHKPELASELVNVALQLSNLGFLSWEALGGLTRNTRKGAAVADILGNLRSVALIQLHLGQVLYFGGKRHEALAAFSSGWQAVQDLGDPDILVPVLRTDWAVFFHAGAVPRSPRTPRTCGPGHGVDRRSGPVQSDGLYPPGIQRPLFGSISSSHREPGLQLAPSKPRFQTRTGYHH